MLPTATPTCATPPATRCRGHAEDGPATEGSQPAIAGASAACTAPAPARRGHADRGPIPNAPTASRAPSPRAPAARPAAPPAISLAAPEPLPRPALRARFLSRGAPGSLG